MCTKILNKALQVELRHRVATHAEVEAVQDKRSDLIIIWKAGQP